MKVMILKGKYKGLTGVTGKVDTDGGYPFVEVTTCNGDEIWLDLQDFKILGESL